MYEKDEEILMKEKLNVTSQVEIYINLMCMT